MSFRFVIVLCAFAVQVHSEKCTTPNNEQGDCISFNSCSVLTAVKNDASVEDFIKKSICGGTLFSPMVCCGTLSNFTLLETNKSTAGQNQNAPKKSLLPNRSFCGLQHSDDYFRDENDTSIRITEFPWLARIRHRLKRSNQEKFQCTGSLINNRYILTGATCLVQPSATVVGVRLGEYHVKNETDCVRELQYEEECSNPVEDFGIEKLIPHPLYNPENFTNDIGLLRLNRSVQYTDYIRPICLPLPTTRLAKVGDVVFTSGWGRTRTSNEAEYKKKISSALITDEECEAFYRSTGQEIRITEGNNMCTVQLSNTTDVECQGDSGGPVMFSPGRLQWHQEGIISAGGAGCGQIKFPGIHTKVEKYIKWIEENLEP